MDKGQASLEAAIPMRQMPWVTLEEARAALYAGKLTVDDATGGNITHLPEDAAITISMYLEQQRPVAVGLPEVYAAYEAEFDDLTIEALQDRITRWGIEKGWTFTEENVPEKLMMMVSELSEAMENYRIKNKEGRSIRDVWFTQTPEGLKPEGFVVELADCIIRILHVTGWMGCRLAAVLLWKMAYNDQRGYRHGDKVA